MEDNANVDEAVLNEIKNCGYIKDLKNHQGWAILTQVFKVKSDAAILNLIDVDPEDFKEIRSLQNEVQKYKELIETVEDLIQVGEQTEYQLKMEQSTGESYA
jgi:hypothetical protein